MRINPDSTFVHVTVAIFDAVITTVLFIVCCLPVVTIGASATAMHATMLSIAEGTCSGVLKKFFGSFKLNFKIATLVWLLAVLVGAVVAADVFVCWGFKMEQNIVLSIMQGVTIGCGLLYFGVLLYVFAGIAKYVVTWKQAIRNAMLWMVKKPLHTIGILVINAAILFSCYLAWFWAFPVVVLLLYLQAMVINSAFGIKRIKAPKPNGGEEEIYYE